MKRKTCRQSLTTMTQLILPNDTNHLGDLMGGTLMRWMDMAGAMAAMRHTNAPVVTAAVDHVSFQKGIPLGAMVVLERSEEHTSELQSRGHLVCRLLLEK